MLDMLFCVQFFMLCHILMANRVKWGPLLSGEHMNMETLAEKFTCPDDMIFETLLTAFCWQVFTHGFFKLIYKAM